MGLSIKDEETSRLAREVATLAGESITQAVTNALRDRLVSLRRKQGSRALADELDEIGRRCAQLPVLDPRTPDEILGYDEHGLPR